MGENQMKVVLEIPEDKVGQFLGVKGRNVRFIIGKTKREIKNEESDIDLSSIFCQINIDEETKEVSALLKASEESHLQVLKRNILAQQEYVLGRVEKKPVDRRPKKKEQKKPQFTTKYVFKTSMEHHMIPKFIGSKGTNINELRGRIILEDENLEGNKVNINITEDKKIRFQRLHFEVLKTEFDSPSKVLISVQLNTKNRTMTLETVRNLVKEFVERTNTERYSGFSPDDSGELDNPF